MVNITKVVDITVEVVVVVVVVVEDDDVVSFKPPY